MTHTRRSFSSFLLFAPTLALAAAAKPNIVVILCDDLGYGDVGCYNPASKIKTPRLDVLSKQGMRFADAHSPSAVCTPTRYGLLTGRYCWRTRLKSGVLNGYSAALIEPGRQTIASLLQKQGYRTGGFGKWHLGLGTLAKADYSLELRPSPNDYGFDHYFGIPASLDMPPYLFFENRKVLEQPTSAIADNGEIKRGPYWRGGPIAPSFKIEEVIPKIQQQACTFIAESAASKQPFFAYVALTGPHTPWVPTKQFKGKSAAGLYGDFVQQIDHTIGQIVDQLDHSAVANNTLLFVTSDNGAPWEKRDSVEAGGHWANASLRGQKADIQEGGHRIPFLVRWPGKVKAAAVCSEPICLTDIFATIAAVEGVNSEAEDSFNLLPLLTGKQGRKPLREAVIHHSSEGLFSIRQGPWKLVLGRGSGGFTEPVKVVPMPGEPDGELYNIASDPHEDRNLYQQRPEVVSRMRDLLETYKSRGFSVRR